ncbi:hypothetical protein HispidOSU_030761, partial [Sigmodon hispidus]
RRAKNEGSLCSSKTDPATGSCSHQSHGRGVLYLQHHDPGHSSSVCALATCVLLV